MLGDLFGRVNSLNKLLYKPPGLTEALLDVLAL